MPRGGGALGSIQAFKTQSHFPGGEWVLFKARSGRKGRDYVERKKIITLLDFQCQRSIFHEGSSCGIMQRGEYLDCMYLSLDILLLPAAGQS